MIQAVVLDSEPLGLLTKPAKNEVSAACSQWISELLSLDVQVVVPEIVDYELRCELLRLNKHGSVALLDAFNLADSIAYLPITTDVMLAAADMWAGVRQQGLPTSDPKALDVDVIPAAQALSLGLPLSNFVVATSNPSHLSRFVIADAWQNIRP